jgi:heme oxygenase (biliverdin-IX-beta and delta-forming)
MFYPRNSRGFAMSVDNAPSTPPEEPAVSARRLVRTALKGSLATLDHETGHPYASLVLVATEPDGAPIFLISNLALHTRNLQRDPRASVLIDGTGDLGDPLSGGRVTLTGEARSTDSATALRRFLARHPSAEGYAGFTDFAVYQLRPSSGHYIGGFGRIVDIKAESLLTDLAGASALIEAEAGIVEHMNSDHADAVALYATELAGCAPGAWRMSGIDPGGLDLLHRTMAARVDFPTRICGPGEARSALVGLASKAREVLAKK